MGKYSSSTLGHQEKVNISKTIQSIYEDEEVIIFDKPAGLLVIPSKNVKVNTLANIVNLQYQERHENPCRLHPCHRLDKETSGAIMFAKGKKAQKRLMGEFKAKRINKSYIAFVHGKISKPAGEIAGEVQSRDKAKYGQKGRRPALTKFKLIKSHKNYSEVAVFPVTGRSNQIRIHFSQIGHPLLGDRKYCVAKDFALKFRRSALHSAVLEWFDKSRQKQSVQIPLPKDMEVFREQH